MKKNRITAMLLAGAMCLTSIFTGTAPAGAAVLPAEEGASRVESILEGMTTRQKITQMMMPDFRYWDEDLTDDKGQIGVTSVNSQIARVVEDYDFGGVILFAQNVTGTKQTLNLTKQYQEAATKDGGIPLLIGIDQEGGSVYRLGTGTALPGNMAVGATGSVEYAKINGEIIGRELDALGINCNFAPDTDVNNNPNNPVIGLRSFSDDPQTVAKMGVAMIQGLNEYNIASAAKHFLGHGDTGTDSHTGLPVVDKSREQLEQMELIPFRAAMDAGADMFMTAHIAYPQIDDTKVVSQKTGEEINLPATLSKKVLTGLVRKDMGFDGVLITDAMNMAAISGNFGQVEASVRAIQAGIDILLMPCVLYNMEDVRDLDAIIEGIEQAVDDGSITEKRLNESCERILKLKEKRGILDYDASKLTEENAEKQVGSALNRQLEREMSAAAVTVLKNENNLLPLDLKADSKVLFLAPYENEMPCLAMGWTRAKQAGLVPEGAECKTMVFDYNMLDLSVETPQIKEALEWADTVFMNSEVSSAYNMQSWRWVTKLPEDVANYCRANGKKSVILSVDKPYDVQHYPNADAILAVYGCMGSSADPTEILNGGVTTTAEAFGPNISAGVEVALGVFGATGKLPVNINRYEEESVSYTDEIVYPRGTGITYASKGVKNTVSGMTLRQKITQMMMPDFRYWDEDLTDDKGQEGVTSVNSQIAKVVEDYAFGGVILFAQNVTGTEQTLNLTKQYQEAATKDGGIPLLIGIDQEGGSVYRLGTGTALPGNMAVGATGSIDYARKNGEIIGRELSSLGINCNFAPVADVNNNPNNPVIGLRSFSDDPNTVARMSVAMIQGMNAYNIATSAKHFLGHGDTGTDSHTGLPVVDKSLEELENMELIPFRAAMESGTDMFMTAHIVYPQIDDTKVVSQKTGEEVNLPATLSKKILSGLVREQMGYDGILITDALNMAGVSGNFGQVEASIRAIQAGIDILLMPCVLYNLEDVKDLDAIIEGIEQAVEDGDIPVERLNESCERILRLKEKRGILEYDGTKLTEANAKEQVGSEQNRAIERDMAAAAVTVVKNENHVLPLDLGADSKVLFLAPYANELPCLAMGWTRAKQARLIPQGAECKTVRFASGSTLETAEIKEALEWADTVFVNSEVSSAANMQSSKWVTKFPTDVANYCKANGKRSVIMSVDKPYDVQHYANADAVLAVYGCKGSSADPTEILNGGITTTEVAFGPNITAGVEVAFGVYGASGRLPVHIYEYVESGTTYNSNIVYGRGHGLLYDPIRVSDRAEAMIEKIGTVACTPECNLAIQSALSYYNALTDDEKAQVGNYNALLAAAAEYNALKTEGLVQEAEAAKDAAEAAREEAVAAKDEAEAAKDAAAAKAGDAETARAAAEAAKAAAEAAAAEAKEAADKAAEDMEGFGEIAELVQAKADAAAAKAEAAADCAQAADDAAQAAAANADAAQAKADAAEAAAELAQGYADAVKGAVDAAQAAADAAGGSEEEAKKAEQAAAAAQAKAEAAKDAAVEARIQAQEVQKDAARAMEDARKAQEEAEKAQSRSETAQAMAEAAQKAAEKAQALAEKAQMMAELEVERAKLEAERAKAEVERAKAEVELAKAEVEKAKAEVEKAKLEAQKSAEAAAATKKMLDDFNASMRDESAIWMGILDEMLAAQEKTKITTAKSKYTVKVGKKVRLKAKSSDGSKLTYRSSNKKVAKVDTKGTVKGIKKGTATITIKANGVKKKVKVTVK